MNCSQISDNPQLCNSVKFLSDGISSGVPGLQQKGATLHIMSDQLKGTMRPTLSSTTEKKEPTTKPDGRDIPDGAPPTTKPDGRDIPDGAPPTTKPDGRDIPDKKDAS